MSSPHVGDPGVGQPVGTTSSNDRGRDIGRFVLGATLVVAGISHLTFQRDEFQAQVPAWFPIKADVVVVASGFVEIALGLALLLLGRRRVPVGWVVAGFFVVIFPGNVAQWAEGNDAFGLDTGAKRFIRLWFQPLLVVWALWSTGAWRAWRVSRAAHTAP